MNGFSDLAIALPILVVSAIAVVTDLRQRRIFNVLTMPAMVAGLVLNTVSNGIGGLGWAFAGLLLGAALFFVPVALGGMGAGDLKLLAALGAIGGPGFVFWCAIYASIAGGAFALVAVLKRRQLMPILYSSALALSTQQMPRATSNMRLPYAVPIALGAAAALVLQ